MMDIIIMIRVIGILYHFIYNISRQQKTNKKKKNKNLKKYSENYFTNFTPLDI